MRWLASSTVVIFLLFSSAIAVELSPITIHADPSVPLHVQIMLSDEERAKGMMHEESWGKRDGMLFVFDRPFQVIMWMKDTPLAMDMVFIGADHTVKHIHRDAVPYSTDYIIGPELTAAVLEVPAGFAMKHGMRLDMRLLYPFTSALLGLFAFSSLANAPVVFQRDVITIIPAPTAVAVIEENMAEQEEVMVEPRNPVDIDVEIRPQDALRLEWIHTLNKLDTEQGVMIVLEEAMPLPLMPLQVFNPIDVVVIDEQGLVSQLIPGVVLAGLAQDIVANRPTKAFLYMRAGAIELYALEPGDRVDHPHFSPEQTVLQ